MTESSSQNGDYEPIFGEGSPADEYFRDPEAFNKRARRETERDAEEWVARETARLEAERKATQRERRRQLFGKLAIWRLLRRDRGVEGSAEATKE